MGAGLKRVAKLCGGIKVISDGTTVEYTASGKVRRKKSAHVDPMTIPLENDQIQVINEIFNECFGEKPEDKAARLLRKAGFTSDHIWKFEKTATGRMVNSCWTTNTTGSLRRMEINAGER